MRSPSSRHVLMVDADLGLARHRVVLMDIVGDRSLEPVPADQPLIVFRGRPPEDVVRVWTVVLQARFVFFFQAEDGIRDLTVTGVQTCALPICFQSLPRATIRRRPTGAGS